jgi:Arc/MetJ-type ribon-helix-helix transcriptional regulator
MVKQKRNKETICATVSPYTKKQVEALVDSGEFGSMSDLVGVAITEFLTKYNAKKEEIENKTKYEKKEIPKDTQVYKRTIIVD